MKNDPQVGRQVVLKDPHPHAGKRAMVLGWQDVMEWPELGPRPVVKTEDGFLCMVTDLDKEWRYDLRISQ